MNLYFDLDGTILDSRTAAVLATQQTFEELFGVHIDDLDVIDKMGTPIEVSFGQFGGGIATHDRLPEALQTFRAIYAELAPLHVTCFPGIPQALQCLRSRGAKFAVVTSKKTAVAVRELGQLGLDGFFETVIGSDRALAYKPNPAPLLLAQGELGRCAVEYMIGDADVDIMMGLAVGMPTIGVTWGSHEGNRLIEAGASAVFDSVEKLEKFLLLRFDDDTLTN